MVICTFMLNIYKPMVNIIISVKGLQKISDRLIRVCIAKFITILYITKFIITNERYNRYQISNRYLLINGEMHVNYPSLLNLVQSVIIINAKYVA